MVGDGTPIGSPMPRPGRGRALLGRGDDLLGFYRRETDSLWRMIYFTTLVWEAR